MIDFGKISNFFEEPEYRLNIEQHILILHCTVESTD